MQPQLTSHVVQSAAQPASATETTGLLSWSHAGAAEAAHAPAQTAHPSNLMDHIAVITHPWAGRTEKVETQAHHFWQIQKPASHPAHPYSPGIADALRYDALAFGARASVAFFGIAGFMDAEFPHGTSIYNPTGTRNNLAGLTCLLGGYIAVTSLTPLLTYHLYCALLYTCNKLGDKLHAHPLSTRAVGLATSAIAATATVVGAVVLHEQNVQHNKATTPEAGWAGSNYGEAAVLSLLVSVPAMAALGWYLGRIGAAAVRRDPHNS